MITKLGILGDTWAASKAAWAVGEGGNSIPLLCSGESPPGTLHPALGYQHRKGIYLLEQVQRKDIRKIRRIKHPSPAKRLRKLDLFSLEKRKLWGDLIVAFYCDLKRDEEEFFTRACRDRISGNGFKLKEDKFRLDFKKFFTVRFMRYCGTGFPEKPAASSLEVLKARLDGIWSTLV